MTTIVRIRRSVRLSLALSAFSVIMFALSPGLAFAQVSVASLQAQLQALLAEIAQLQSQAGGTGSVTTGSYAGSCPSISRHLSLGSSGSDVASLQQFLASNPTIYPEGLVTGYYGLLTQAAVQRFQTANGIISYGSPETTGYGAVGPRTAAAIALACSNGGGGSGSGGPTAGGLIQLSPINGSVPLTVNVQATVNTVSSCSGSLYTLNYGDGSAPVTIPTYSNNCSPIQQTFSHIYTNPGTYTVTLSSGASETTANVVVNSAVNIPPDSLQASITSGSSPLAVIFTGTVSNLASTGCVGSCGDTINFGDGQIGIVAIPTTSNSWQSFLINHTYTAAGTYIAQLKSVTGANDGSPVTITATGVATTTTMSISADNTALMVGQSTVVRASFTAAPGDTLTTTDINGSAGGALVKVATSGLENDTTLKNPLTYTFTPTAAGTYTFTPYALTTQHVFPNWQTSGGSVTVTVSNGSSPTMSISASAASIKVGASATITANFTASSGDTLTTTDINGSAGGALVKVATSGLENDTTLKNPLTYTFTPTAAGTYTFTPYALTNQHVFPNWQTSGGSVTVTATQ